MRLTHFKVSQRELDLPDQGLGAPGGREVDQVIRRVGLLGQASNSGPRAADGVETAAGLLDDLGPVLLNGVRRRRRRCRVSERSQQVLLEGVGPGCQPTLHSSTLPLSLFLSKTVDQNSTSIELSRCQLVFHQVFFLTRILTSQASNNISELFSSKRSSNQPLSNRILILLTTYFSKIYSRGELCVVRFLK